VAERGVLTAPAGLDQLGVGPTDYFHVVDQFHRRART
jgi:hypothetical protein